MLDSAGGMERGAKTRVATTWRKRRERNRLAADE